MDHMFRLILIVILLAGLVSTALGRVEFKVCLIKRTETPPVIDGVLEDECWHNADKLENFIKLGGTEKAKEQTVFQVAYDSQNLYLAIECQASGIAQSAAEYTKHDSSNIFKNECVEIFIDARHDHFNYFHFAANVAGTQYEAKRLDSSWDMPWQLKSKIGRNKWQLEIAIPWKSLGVEPSKQSIIGLNVCRERYAEKGTEISSWAKVERFHSPSQFGHLVCEDGQLLLAKLDKQYEIKQPLTSEDFNKIIADCSTLTNADINKIVKVNAVAADFNTINGRDLVDCKDPAKWQGMVKVNTEKMRSGKNCFELYGKYATRLESEIIPVSMKKTYRLSCFMRSLDAGNPASGNFGLLMYDKDKQFITMRNVQPVEYTETVLAAPASKGAKELLIECNNKWLGANLNRVAFNIKDNYEDLPNFNCSPQIKTVIDEGKQYKVILTEPISNDYPAHVRVRMHSPYAAPLFWIAHGWMPAEWKECFGIITGEAQSGTPGNSFWKGTKFVRVFAWFGTYEHKPRPGAVLLIDDIRFIEQ